MLVILNLIASVQVMCAPEFCMVKVTFFLCMPRSTLMGIFWDHLTYITFYLMVLASIDDPLPTKSGCNSDFISSILFPPFPLYLCSFSLIIMTHGFFFPFKIIYYKELCILAHYHHFLCFSNYSKSGLTDWLLYPCFVFEHYFTFWDRYSTLNIVHFLSQTWN